MSIRRLIATRYLPSFLSRSPCRVLSQASAEVVEPSHALSSSAALARRASGAAPRLLQSGGLVLTKLPDASLRPDCSVGPGRQTYEALTIYRLSRPRLRRPGKASLLEVLGPETHELTASGSRLPGSGVYGDSTPKFMVETLTSRHNLAACASFHPVMAGPRSPQPEAQFAAPSGVVASGGPKVARDTDRTGRVNVNGCTLTNGSSPIKGLNSSGSANGASPGVNGSHAALAGLGLPRHAAGATKEELLGKIRAFLGEAAAKRTGADGESQAGAQVGSPSPGAVPGPSLRRSAEAGAEHPCPSSPGPNGGSHRPADTSFGVTGAHALALAHHPDLHVDVLGEAEVPLSVLGSLGSLEEVDPLAGGVAGAALGGLRDACSAAMHGARVGVPMELEEVQRQQAMLALAHSFLELVQVRKELAFLSPHWDSAGSPPGGLTPTSRHRHNFTSPREPAVSPQDRSRSLDPSLRLVFPVPAAAMRPSDAGSGEGPGSAGAEQARTPSGLTPGAADMRLGSPQTPQSRIGGSWGLPSPMPMSRSSSGESQAVELGRGSCSPASPDTLPQLPRFFATRRMRKLHSFACDQPGGGIAGKFREGEPMRPGGPGVVLGGFREGHMTVAAKHKQMAEILGGIPRKVKLVEVGPRDGLQNETSLVPLEVKLELIHRLAKAGLPVVEATSFVSPKWVPQLADGPQIMDRLREEGQLEPAEPDTHATKYPVLTPNLKGFSNAVAHGAREVAVFASATEAFSKNNINCSIAESLRRYEEVCSAAKENGVSVRGYVSCVVGCPFEGAVQPSQVALVARALYDMGCYEISLGDTIGVGTPGTVVPMLEAVLSVLPREAVAVHFHDTYGQALANILIALQMGVTIIDSSVAGLGGCPYAKGASGNVATEDVVYLLHGLGVQTGVSLEALLDTVAFISKHLGRRPNSRVAAAMLKGIAADSEAKL